MSTKTSFFRMFMCCVLLMLVFSGCTSYSASADVVDTVQAQEPTRENIKKTPTPEATQTLRVEPSPSATPTETACSETRGQLIDADVPNKVLSHPLQVKIYLPPCYEKHPNTPYPYVIMIHGMLYTDDQWDRLGADEAADELITSGEVPPFMILMPLEEQSTANPFEDGFGDAITNGLVPWVEQNYPVCTDRSCRAIGGLSRGAGWAIHIGLSKPEYFSAIGAHSLPIFIGDLASTPRWLSAIKQADMPRVYIDIGIGDGGITQATQFEQILTAYNVPHEWYINNGEHTEGYWSSHVKDYMRWYASGWKTTVPPVVLN